MFFLDGMRVLDVEVVVAFLDRVDADLPGDLVLFPLVPPVHARLEMLQPDRLGHGIGFLALGNPVLVEPDRFGRFALLEKQQVGADAGIGFEDAVRQADDGVEVALREQVFLEPGLDAFAEEGAVGQDHGGAAPRLQQAHDERQEQVGGLAGLEMLGEVALDAVFLFSAEGGIGEDDVDPVGLAVADVGLGQGVVVVHEGRVVDAVEQHVGDAEHVGELFLFGSAEPLLHFLLVFGLFHVAFAHMGDGAGEEAPGTAGGVEQHLAGFGVDAVGHEGGDGAGGVVFARVARALEVVENLLVDVAEVLALFQVVEVDGVDLVDDLAHELAGLHVVVGVFEHVAHDAAASILRGPRQFLQRGEQFIVDETQQFVAGDAFRVARPRPPLEFLRDGGGVAIPSLHEFQFLVLVVDDFEEEHPAQLRDALGVAVDADILAHDVLDGFDGGAYGHALFILLPVMFLALENESEVLQQA